jgi:hypothetical protein
LLIAVRYDKIRTHDDLIWVRKLVYRLPGARLASTYKSLKVILHILFDKFEEEGRLEFRDDGADGWGVRGWKNAKEAWAGVLAMDPSYL